MNKPLLQLGECRRGCGARLSTLSRSLYGLPDEIREKYHLICNRCMTKKEKNEMLEKMGNAITIKLSGRVK